MGTRTKIGIALLLTLSAGLVDIIGFLTFYSTFTAHMTGVTVHLGQYVAAQSSFDILVLLGVLGAFLVGSIAGRAIVEIAVYRNLRSAASLALFSEAALIFAVAFAGGSGASKVMMTLLLASAMGLQTAALTRVGALTVHTTFVTGMLNKLAQLLSQALMFPLRGRTHPRSRAQLLQQSAFLGTIWLAYFVGAVLGALMKSHWAAHSLLLPASIALTVAIVDLINPLSIEEERDIAER
jgi:uncharacterized membrane protein YoaK (UPF0700 family)